MSSLSARWLIANNKTAEARAVIEKAASRNGVKLSSEVFQSAEASKVSLPSSTFHPRHSPESCEAL